MAHPGAEGPGHLGPQALKETLEAQTEHPRAMAPSACPAPGDPRPHLTLRGASVE